jgi:hypothetical protein
VLGWALLAEVVPIYPLYALWFADAGLSGAQISVLFAIWSTVGMLAEVPAGVLADRCSRRLSLAAGGALQAAGYAVWTLSPQFGGFSAGFVLWGLGGACVSSASEALIFDGLAARGARDRFAAVLGQVSAAGLIAQLPAAALATALYRMGGYVLAGWASVAICAVVAVSALLLPDTRESPSATTPVGPAPDADAEPTLRAAWRDLRSRPLVRAAVLAVAALTGLDALEEYVPLLARAWTVPVAAVPLAVLGLPLAGAVGAVMAGRAGRSGRSRCRSGNGPAPAVLLAAAGILLLGASLVRVPAGLVALFACYGIYRAVLVRAGVRLQERITGPARATVTSLAALGGELTAFGTYAAWAVGGGAGIAVLVLAVAAVLPVWLRTGAERLPGVAGKAPPATVRSPN